MRATRRPGIVSAVDTAADTVTITLELDRSGDRIAGSLHGHQRVPRRFDGWLELGTLLERARREDPERPSTASGSQTDARVGT